MFMVDFGIGYGIPGMQNHYAVMGIAIGCFQSFNPVFYFNAP